MPWKLCILILQMQKYLWTFNNAKGIIDEEGILDQILPSLSSRLRKISSPLYPLPLPFYRLETLITFLDALSKSCCNFFVKYPQVSDIEHGARHKLYFTGGRIVNVTSGLGRIERLKRTFQDQINQANTLEELGLINSGGSEPGSSSYTPTYDVSKAMLNKATQIMSKLPEFQHIAINAASPGWCR